MAEQLVNVETCAPFSDWRQDILGPPEPNKGGSSLVIATVMNRKHPDGEGNARLIAAAPDLLEACEHAMAVIHAVRTGHVPPDLIPHIDSERMVRAAIAAARGES